MTSVVAGALSLVAGAVLLLLTPFGNVGAGVFAGLVVAAGGLVLLRRRRLGLSAWVVAPVALLAGVAGTLAGLAVSSARTCCMFAYTESRGWPYAWLSRGATADTPAEAERLAAAGGWELSAPVHLLAGAVVWAYAGLVLIALVSRVGLIRSGRIRPAQAG